MLSGSVEPVDIDFATIILNEELAPAAFSAALAAEARDALAEAEQQNAAALGYAPGYTTLVDGVPGVDESRVLPNGEIVYAFDLQADLLGWIYDMLEQFAPLRSGRFKTSIHLYADGVAIDPHGLIPLALEFVFESVVAYAGKIEGESGPPESPQAPNGVFEAVATLAQQHFAGQAAIAFSYRPPIEEASQHVTPAITITTGR